MQTYKRFKQAVRDRFLILARVLDRLFKGQLTANGITAIALLLHLPIAYLLAMGYLWQAALCMIVFGLLDTLDGAMAKVQNTTSPRGMFLDAATDRLKEVLIYIGLTAYFAMTDLYWGVIAAVAACGISLSISYVKAKGEAAIAAKAANGGTTLSHAELNRVFDDGVASYEIRIGLLSLGCLVGAPEYIVAFVIVIGLATLGIRTAKIMRALA